jgi:hypothetical protein
MWLVIDNRAQDGARAFKIYNSHGYIARSLKSILMVLQLTHLRRVSYVLTLSNRRLASVGRPKF